MLIQTGFDGKLNFLHYTIVFKRKTKLIGNVIGSDISNWFHVIASLIFLKL